MHDSVVVNSNKNKYIIGRKEKNILIIKEICHKTNTITIAYATK